MKGKSLSGIDRKILRVERIVALLEKTETFYQVKMAHIRSARLTSGTLSIEQATSPDHHPKRVDNDNHRSPTVDELLEAWSNTSPPNAPVNVSHQPSRFDHTSQPGGPHEETITLSRPAWQSFVLFLQLHHPEISQDVQPAHKIGLLQCPRVTINPDAVSTLNYFIESVYGKEVEVITTHVVTDKSFGTSSEVETMYQATYRPVTGLRVVVTPVMQGSRDRYNLTILREKEKWGLTASVKNVVSAWELLVKEKVRGLEKGKTGKKKLGWAKWVSS